eukprot:NODE_492_length_2416_cov_75.402966_g467_i0.p1 GENE.NODE_492_length_2416_cov_75.402966_g467_i0~~NODE_492_length_2416_cov_75.402966_g467_i0.p1  ORF type:complete len:705 (+),score=103.93 NODE_492_length_2416_cov_75.402966_g467_i0:106-2220(+)
MASPVLALNDQLQRQNLQLLAQFDKLKREKEEEQRHLELLQQNQALRSQIELLLEEKGLSVGPIAGPSTDWSTHNSNASLQALQMYAQSPTHMQSTRTSMPTSATIQLQGVVAPCGHNDPTNWKRLRLKKGLQHFLCFICGMKWKTPSRGEGPSRGGESTSPRGQLPHRAVTASTLGTARIPGMPVSHGVHFIDGNTGNPVTNSLTSPSICTMLEDQASRRSSLRQSEPQVSVPPSASAPLSSFGPSTSGSGGKGLLAIAQTMDNLAVLRKQAEEKKAAQLPISRSAEFPTANSYDSVSSTNRVTKSFTMPEISQQRQLAEQNVLTASQTVPLNFGLMQQNMWNAAQNANHLQFPFFQSSELFNQSQGNWSSGMFGNFSSSMGFGNSEAPNRNMRKPGGTGERGAPGWELNEEYNDKGRRLDNAAILVYSVDAETGEWVFLLGQQAGKPGSTNRVEFFSDFRGYFDFKNDNNILSTATRKLREATRNVNLRKDIRPDLYCDLPHIVKRETGPVVEATRLFLVEVDAEHREAITNEFGERCQITNRRQNTDKVYPATAFDAATGQLRPAWREFVSLKWWTQSEVIEVLAQEGISRTPKGDSKLLCSCKRTLVRFLLPGGVEDTEIPLPKLRAPLTAPVLAQWNELRDEWNSTFASLQPNEEVYATYRAHSSRPAWIEMLRAFAMSQSQPTANGDHQTGTTNQTDV